MECQFVVGQKVVCVDEKLIPGFLYDILPIKGRIYTIRGFGITSQDRVGVFLEEIKRPLCPVNNKEMPYGSFRFRPLKEKKSDISIFKEMLNKSPSESKLNLKVLENG